MTNLKIKSYTVIAGKNIENNLQKSVTGPTKRAHHFNNTLMQNFELYNPVNIIFGKDQLRKLPKLLPDKARILLLYGGGSIFKNKVHEQVIENVQGFEVFEFGGIEPNPHYNTCMAAVEVIRKNNLNFILAVGGGSVIDAAKFIAAASLYTDGDAWDILSKKISIKNALEFGAILTLPATPSWRASFLCCCAIASRCSSINNYYFQLTWSSYSSVNYYLQL